MLSGERRAMHYIDMPVISSEAGMNNIMTVMMNQNNIIFDKSQRLVLLYRNDMVGYDIIFIYDRLMAEPAADFPFSLKLLQNYILS